MPAPPSQGEPEQVIARRYELLDLIGQGGHGLVWKARDRADGKLVAVKMLTDVAAKDPQQIERLRREHMAMLKLAGTNAVGLVDLCRSPSNKLCLVMELLDGVDFEQYLAAIEARGERCSTREMMRVLGPIVETMDRAHREGILHRDLKPANIFLVADASGGGVRLLDFGLARLRSALPLTAAGTIVGSPSYIAPEAWKGKSDGLDQRVDVYSFGVTVFRALTARLPFEGKTLQEKFKLTTTAPRPSLWERRPELPKEVDDWLEEVLAIDREQRFRTIRGAWSALLSSIGAREAETELERAVREAPMLSASSVIHEPALTPGAIQQQPEPSASIELPMQGALPGLAKAWNAATRAVKRLAEVIQPARRPSAEPETPAPHREEDEIAPPPVSQPPETRRRPVYGEHDGVAIAPVLAVGQPMSEDDKSFAREWLAGTDLDTSRPSHPEDVVAWLAADPPVHEPTLQFGVEQLDDKKKKKKKEKKKQKRADKKAGKKRSGGKKRR
jgi:serine/threonine-protein kinase